MPVLYALKLAHGRASYDPYPADGCSTGIDHNGADNETLASYTSTTEALAAFEQESETMRTGPREPHEAERAVQISV